VNNLIEQEGDVKINETEKQRSDPIMDNIQTEKRIKVNSRKSGIQKGSGKSYVKMSPLQFSKFSCPVLCRVVNFYSEPRNSSCLSR
jgi:hypothetical protein